MTTDITERPSPQSENNSRSGFNASNTDEATPEFEENVSITHKDHPARASGVVIAKEKLHEPERVPKENPAREERESAPSRRGTTAMLEDAVVPNNQPVNGERRSLRGMFVLLVTVGIVVVATLLKRNWICTIPLASSLCGSNGDVFVQEPRFQDIVEIQSGFEPLLELTGYGISLAKEMKKSEAAVGDLSRQVKYSDLEYRGRLSKALESFTGTAKAASRHLIGWDATVIGAVDSVLNMEDGAIRTLEYFDQDERTKSIFSSSPSQVQTRAQLIEKFEEVAGSLKKNLRKLKEVSVATAALLQRAETELANIHEIVTKEGGDANKKRNEVLTDIWAWTRPKTQIIALSEIDEEKDLLSKVEGVRTTAADQIGKSTVHLEAMEVAIDALREQVATPVRLRDTSIPLRLHIDTLKAGFDKLEESKLRARARQDRVINMIVNGPQDPEIS